MGFAGVVGVVGVVVTSSAGVSVDPSSDVVAVVVVVVAVVVVVVVAAVAALIDRHGVAIPFCVCFSVVEAAAVSTCVWPTFLSAMWASLNFFFRSSNFEKYFEIKS